MVDTVKLSADKAMDPEKDLLWIEDHLITANDLRTNTALLRRKIGHPDLTFEAMRVGRKTRTEVSIAYIRGIARDDLVTEVRRRIGRIDTDAVLATAYINEFIEDAPLSLFPTSAYTERPDAAAAKLLEWRVAIMMAGTPTVYTVPALLMESFQNPDDYHFRPFYATLIPARFGRFYATDVHRLCDQHLGSSGS